MTKTMSLEEYEEYRTNSGATYTGTTAGPTTMGATYTSPRLVPETSPMPATTTYAGATYTGTTTEPTTTGSTYTGATYTGATYTGPTTTKTMSLEEYEEYRKNSGATYGNDRGTDDHGSDLLR